MVASTSGGPKGPGVWIAAGCLGLTLGLYACATTDAPDWNPQFSDVKAGALSDVVVEHDGAVTLVTLVGLEDPVYSIYRETDPEALVLEVTAEDASKLTEPVRVYDGLVEEVAVSSYSAGAAGAKTRIEVSLSDEAEYDVTATWDGLMLLVRPASEDLAEETVPEVQQDPWEDPEIASVPIADVEAAEDFDFDTAPAAVSAAPASELSAVEVISTQNGVLIHLRGDGSILSSDSFTLENPERLVIDLAGLENGVREATQGVNLETVSQVRVGAHPDKVRVVVDAGSGPSGFAARRVVAVADGLVVALGSGADLDEALAARVALTAEPGLASEPEAPVVFDALPVVASIEEEVAEATNVDSEQAEPFVESETVLTEADAFAADAVEPGDLLSDAPASAGWESEEALVTVHGINVNSQGDRERIAVLAERTVEYRVYRPDPETLVVSLLGATIPEEAQGRLLPPFGGPVSVVTVFQQPDVAQPEVRVVMKRAAGLEPEITRHGALLFIDFPLSGDAAAPPPAFADALVASASPQLSDSSAAKPENADAMEFVLDGPIAEPADAGFAVADSGSEALSGLASGPAAVPVTASAAPASLDPPAAVELLQEGGLIDGKEYQGRRISLDFKSVQIGDVLRIIADVSDLNIVAGDEVKGGVTIRLVDVPWDQALDVILLTQGLGFVRVGNVLRIAPTDILQREEELRLQERRNKEKLEDLVVKLQSVNYADVTEMSKLIKRLLTSRGTVNVDQRTSTLIIKDIPSVIDEATALIEAIDTQTPQVMIEAKIVEANLDFSRELGSVWSVGTQPLLDPFDSESDPVTTRGSEDLLFHDNNSVVFANPITSLASGLLNLNTFILDQKFDVGIQIAAVEASGDGKVISSPRVVTLDNRTAEISQGVSIPFQTFENGDAKLEFIDAVLKLEVTPHITADESIIMKIEVTRNAPDDTVQTPTGSPAIAKNEAKTETLVKDGQTLVIGGIYTVTKTQRESRVPYLHAIPLIGNAFRSREVTDKRKELLIFVTPRLVRQYDAGG